MTILRKKRGRLFCRRIRVLGEVCGISDERDAVADQGATSGAEKRRSRVRDVRIMQKQNFRKNGTEGRAFLILKNCFLRRKQFFLF